MLDLFEQIPPDHAFDGQTYSPELDYKRLKGQRDRVFQLMSDGQWRTLAEISQHAGGSEASASARLRDLRKPKYGSHDVQGKRVAGGLWRYRMVVQG